MLKLKLCFKINDFVIKIKEKLLTVNQRPKMSTYKIKYKVKFKDFFKNIDKKRKKKARKRKNTKTEIKVSNINFILTKIRDKAISITENIKNCVKTYYIKLEKTVRINKSSKVKRQMCRCAGRIKKLYHRIRTIKRREKNQYILKAMMANITIFLWFKSGVEGLFILTKYQWLGMLIFKNQLDGINSLININEYDIYVFISKFIDIYVLNSFTIITLYIVTSTAIFWKKYKFTFDKLIRKYSLSLILSILVYYLAGIDKINDINGLNYSCTYIICDFSILASLILLKIVEKETFRLCQKIIFNSMAFIIAYVITICMITLSSTNLDGDKVMYILSNIVMVLVIILFILAQDLKRAEKPRN